MVTRRPLVAVTALVALVVAGLVVVGTPSEGGAKHTPDRQGKTWERGSSRTISVPTSTLTGPKRFKHTNYFTCVGTNPQEIAISAYDTMIHYDCDGIVGEDREEGSPGEDRNKSCYITREITDGVAEPWPKATCGHTADGGWDYLDDAGFASEHPDEFSSGTSDSVVCEFDTNANTLRDDPFDEHCGKWVVDAPSDDADDTSSVDNTDDDTDTVTCPEGQVLNSNDVCGDPPTTTCPYGQYLNINGLCYQEKRCSSKPSSMAGKVYVLRLWGEDRIKVYWGNPDYDKPWQYDCSLSFVWTQSVKPGHGSWAKQTVPYGARGDN